LPLDEIGEFSVSAAILDCTVGMLSTLPARRRRYSCNLIFL